MNRPHKELLLTLQVIASQQGSGLQVFGLRWSSESQLGYHTLDEAMAVGTLEVTEISEGGSVPTLSVTNKSERMTFLTAGEQLVGAKQNRVLNVSIMVPSTTLQIPVSCVEAGRWPRRSVKFASGLKTSHGKFRKMMSKQTYLRQRTARSPTSDQAAVWDEVSRKLLAMGCASPSQAFDQVYHDYAASLNDLGARLQPLEGRHGVMFAAAGQIEGAEFFDQPATLGRLWPKLSRAYAFDVFEVKDPESSVTAEEAELWVRSAAGAKVEQFSTPGLRQDIRLEAPGLTGAALIVEGQPVRVELFVD
jgi:hypothetical protein